MSKLNIDQKSIKALFSDKKADFLIPDYQRPYAWEEKECERLWDDIFEFAIPENDASKFDSGSEYFLGPIVTFKNSDGKSEVIDGQQRLTTLMLLLRAFYSKCGKMQDSNSKATRETIEQCIWKTDEFSHPLKDELKIDSEVASDDEKDVFLNILKTGEVAASERGNYAANYRFFCKKIAEFLDAFPSYFAYLPMRIMNNCIMLPIEAESQDTALRIFSTLNDRGKPLSDADIFKAQFYKYFSNTGRKDDFIRRWKELEKLCDNIFAPLHGTPMDEIFVRYMYFERAKQGIKDTTTEALRKFYEKNSYALLKTDETFEALNDLAEFWKSVVEQDDDRFSEEVLRKLFILGYAPNGMWAYIVSVYYMKNRQPNGKLDEAPFVRFLDRITAYIWSYALVNPGVNQLRAPMYAEMLKIIEGNEVDFSGMKIDPVQLDNAFRNYKFTNGRPITKSMLVWWAMQIDGQELPAVDKTFEIEHIIARERQSRDKVLSSSQKLESLGNKAILEKGINIRAADYRFTDKFKYYKGYESKGRKKGGTVVKELLDFTATRTDFVESDVDKRFEDICWSFMKFVEDNKLFKS